MEATQWRLSLLSTFQQVLMILFICNFSSPFFTFAWFCGKTASSPFPIKFSHLDNLLGADILQEKNHLHLNTTQLVSVQKTHFKPNIFVGKKPGNIAIIKCMEEKSILAIGWQLLVEQLVAFEFGANFLSILGFGSWILDPQCQANIYIKLKYEHYIFEY